MYPCPPLLKADLKSLDFVIIRFIMKLFNTNNIQSFRFVNNIFLFSCRVIFGLNALTNLKKFAKSSNSSYNITAYVL